MKAVRPIVFTALVLVLLASIAGPATASPGVTIRLLNRLPPTLAVDESYTIDILVRSDEPFRLAMAKVAMTEECWVWGSLTFHWSGV